MKLFSESDNYKLYNGSMLDMLEVIEKNSIDSIVTDPPYELGFMNKGWDSSGIAFQKETWEKCFEALKPGGYLLAFGGSRTFHRIATAIEDAGFEIRDTIMWLYGSGFIKSMNIALQFDKEEGLQGQRGLGGFNVAGMGAQESRDAILYTRKAATEAGNGAYTEPKGENAKKWFGWGTALKPAYEPVIVARKPLDGSTTNNLKKYGVGGFNLDECRIGNETRTYKNQSLKKPEGAGCFRDDNWIPKQYEKTVNGRIPSNVVFTYDETDFDEVCGGMPVGGKNGNITKNYKMNNQVYGEYGYCNTFDAYEDSGSAARYFYCAKASTKDRDEGLEEFEKVVDCDRNEECYSANVPMNRSATAKRNTHPTVKPTELMQYLIRLVTPNGGIILDPFNGSGSTGKAAMWENRERNKGYKYIGIEITESYLPIARARIEYALVAPTEEQQEQIPGQMSLFDLYKTGE